MKKCKPSVVPSDLQDLIDQSTGKGVSTVFSDRAHWLTPEEEEHVGWLNVLAEVDRTRNLQPLLWLLQRLAPSSVQPHLEDFFLRHQTTVKRTRGRQRRSPSYQWDTGYRALQDAVTQVRALRATGMTLDARIERVATERGMRKSRLRAAVQSKHAGFRRAQKKFR